MSQPPSENNFPIPVVIQSDVIFHDFVKVRKDILERRDGKHYRYYTLEVLGSAALVLAKTTDGLFVITKEYRHPAEKTLLSLAGGYIDKGENPLEAAKRELLEETGYTAENFVILGASYPYAGISSQKIYYIYADNARHVQAPQLEISEQIEVHPMTYQTFKSLAIEGSPIDGNLLTAFSWLNINNMN
ncbi:MAG: NUDIX hydrolase [Parachlamydiales bacterium]|jgi:ADP-ribose pyrophosphatase